MIEKSPTIQAAKVSHLNSILMSEMSVCHELERLWNLTFGSRWSMKPWPTEPFWTFKDILVKSGWKDNQVSNFYLTDSLDLGLWVQLKLTLQLGTLWPSKVISSDQGVWKTIKKVVSSLLMFQMLICHEL